MKKVTKMTQALSCFNGSVTTPTSPESSGYSVLSIVERVSQQITDNNEALFVQALTLRFWDATLRTERSYQDVTQSFQLDTRDPHAQRRVSQHFLPSRLYDIKRSRAPQTGEATTSEVNILKGGLVSVASTEDLKSDLGMMLVRHSLHVLTAYDTDENTRRQVLNQIRKSCAEFKKPHGWPQTHEDNEWMNDIKRSLCGTLSEALKVLGDPDPLLRIELSDSQIRQAENEQWTVPCMAPWLAACLSKLSQDATATSPEYPITVVGSRAEMVHTIQAFPLPATARAFPA